MNSLLCLCWLELGLTWPYQVFLEGGYNTVFETFICSSSGILC